MRTPPYVTFYMFVQKRMCSCRAVPWAPNDSNLFLQVGQSGLEQAGAPLISMVVFYVGLLV